MDKRWPKTTPLLRTLSAAVLLVVLGLIIYANTLNAPFVFDDLPNITENPHIRLTDLSSKALTGIFKSRSAHRPLSNFSLALNYYFHAYEVRGYHLINLTIHILTALLIWIFARQTIILSGSGSRRVPFFAAALWLVNPLHTQSVTYIVQRMNSLSTLFFMLAFTCYIQARMYQHRKGMNLTSFLFFVGCGLSGLAGLAAKETVAVLPILILLYEWYFFQNLNRGWLKRQAPWIVIVVVITAAAAFIFLDGHPLAKLNEMYGKRPFSLCQRLLTEPAVVVYYLCLLVYPHPARLILDYDFPLAGGPVQPPVTALAIVALLALATSAVYSARRNRLLSFTLLWFLVTLVIESSIIGLDLIFEHRTYLPSVLPAIGLTSLLFHWIKPAPLAATLLSVMIGLSAVGTYQRNQVWRTDLGLWRDNVAKSPNEPRSYVNLGRAYKERDLADKAMDNYQRARQLSNPNDQVYVIALNNIGELLLMQNRLQEAAAVFETAVNAYPGYADAHINLGVALMRLGQADEAIDVYNRILAINPDLEKAYNNLGNAWFSKGDVSRAVHAFEQALEVNPRYPEARQNLNKLNRIINKYGRLIDQMETIARQRPDDPDAAYQSGQINLAAGMNERAVFWFKRAMSLDPDRALYLNALGNAAAAAGRLVDAAETFERLARQLPENPTVFYNLACLYARQNDTDRAVANLKKAIERGYARWGHLKTDPDIENIRETDYFKSLVH